MSELLEECVERAKPPGRPRSNSRIVRIVTNNTFVAAHQRIDNKPVLMCTLGKQWWKKNWR